MFSWLFNFLFTLSGNILYFLISNTRTGDIFRKQISNKPEKLLTSKNINEHTL